MWQFDGERRSLEYELGQSHHRDTTSRVFLQGARRRHPNQLHGRQAADLQGFYSIRVQGLLSDGGAGFELVVKIVVYGNN